MSRTGRTSELRICVGSPGPRHIGNDRLLEQQSGEDGVVAVSIQAPPALQVPSPYRAGTNHRLAGGLDLGDCSAHFASADCHNFQKRSVVVMSLETVQRRWCADAKQKTQTDSDEGGGI